jgi:crossover junction endodeoxyribonuclease RusA
MIQITLPFPPGVNNLFATVGKRRVRSKRYREWSSAAWLAAMQQPRPDAIQGPFIASFLVTRPDKRKRDLDGLLKAPLDFLVELGLIDDDSMAQSLTIEWLGYAKPGSVIITLEAA